MEASSKDTQRQKKKPMSDGAKVALILGSAALTVLLVAVICFYSFMNKYMSTSSGSQSTNNQKQNEQLFNGYETKELTAGTYKVPDDIEIAAYYVYADSDMQFIATGADGEIDIKKNLEAFQNDMDNILSIITEDQDSIQLIGSGKVTFVKIGEAKDYTPSDNTDSDDNNNNNDNDRKTENTQNPQKKSDDEFV